MPRGRFAKQIRNHKRAAEAGRSTRGSSQLSAAQSNGKKYKKKQMCRSGTQMSVLHEGNVYIVYYKLENKQITIEGVVSQKHIDRFSVNNFRNLKIRDQELLGKIIEKFMIKLSVS